MWKPDESLEDYVVTPPPEVTPDPPPGRVWLRRTGKFEILRPLAGEDVSPQITFKAIRPSVRPQPLWFRRFLAVGSGALVMMALVLVSAILVSISEPVPEPDVAENSNPLGELMTQPEAPFNLDSSSPSSSAPAALEFDIIPSSSRRWSARRSIHRAVNKPKRQARRLPQFEQSDFTPTTLVIYAKNGVVYTRIEPWLQTVDKKITTFNN